jgi:hypothetical protein
MKARDLILTCFLTVFQPRGVMGLGAWMATNINLRSTEKPGKPGAYVPGETPLPAMIVDDFDFLIRFLRVYGVSRIAEWRSDATINPVSPWRA